MCLHFYNTVIVFATYVVLYDSLGEIKMDFPLNMDCAQGTTSAGNILKSLICKSLGFLIVIRKCDQVKQCDTGTWAGVAHNNIWMPQLTILT